MNPTADDRRQQVWERAGNFLTEYMGGSATVDHLEHGVDDAATLGLVEEEGEEARAYTTLAWTQFSLDADGVAVIRDSDHITEEDRVYIESGMLRIVLLSDPFDILKTPEASGNEDDSEE